MEYADLLAALFTSNDDQGAFGIPKEKVISEAVGYLPWRNAEFVFTSIRPFFDSEVFSVSILKGLITSSGGLTESTLKASSNSLFEYLSSMRDPSHKKHFLGKLIRIFELNLRDERVTVPLMKTIEMLLASDYLTEQTEILLDELTQIHAVTVQECSKSKNIVKLMSSAGVFAAMLVQTDKTLLGKCVKSLLFLLYHAFPRVRKLTAEKLYTALLTMEDATILMTEDSYDQAVEMLSETNWDGVQLKELNLHKDRMYGLFGLVPPPKTTATVAKPNSDVDMKIIQT